MLKSNRVGKFTISDSLYYNENLEALNTLFKDVYPIGDDVYISGYINDTTNTYNKGIITRYTSNGTESWTVSVTNGTNNVAFNSVALDGVNVIAAGFNESSSVLVNIQRNLAGNLGVVTSENWILSTSSGSYSSSSIASKNIQNMYTQSPTIG
jgi:hypothetical protein